MIKSYSSKNEIESVTDSDLELINKYALRPLTKDEVFTFSVILCDNDIDRDFERFSEASLRSLEKLFVGKTGIFNHSMQSEDQSSRTYRTELLTDRSRKTADGKDYIYLKAWCYTVRSEKNSSLICDIESGIKKEVSVSCNSGRKICSVCGENHCSHIAGRDYDGAVCFKTIEDVTDAYEWSFVAVPAQKNAGVTKSMSVSKKEKNMENILKSVKGDKEVTFKTPELKKLAEYICRLEKECEDGKKYRLSLCEKAKKEFAVALPSLDTQSVDEITKSLTSDGLEKLCNALSKQTSKIIPSVSQLYKNADEKTDESNQEFKF